MDGKEFCYDIFKRYSELTEIFSVYDVNMMIENYISSKMSVEEFTYIYINMDSIDFTEKTLVDFFDILVFFDAKVLHTFIEHLYINYFLDSKFLDVLVKYDIVVSDVVFLIMTSLLSC